MSLNGIFLSVTITFVLNEIDLLSNHSDAFMRQKREHPLIIALIYINNLRLHNCIKYVYNVKELQILYSEVFCVDTTTFCKIKLSPPLINITINITK